MAAVEEPARFYFDAAGNGCWRDHVNVHGLNWYLSMVRGAFDAEYVRRANEAVDVHLDELYERTGELRTSGLYGRESSALAGDGTTGRKDLGARRFQRMHTYSQNSHLWPLDHGWRMWPTAGSHGLHVRRVPRRFTAHLNNVKTSKGSDV